MHLHNLQTLRDRLRSMPGRLTLHIGPYDVPMFGACDPMVRQFSDEFVADLLEIVEVRISDLQNESSHAPKRHSTTDMGDGVVGGPAK